MADPDNFIFITSSSNMDPYEKKDELSRSLAREEGKANMPAGESRFSANDSSVEFPVRFVRLD